MYDPVETDLSYQYLLKLREAAVKLSWGVLGGWGVFFHVNEKYTQAFGREYLKSRDIDIFVDVRDEEKFLGVIKKLNFNESAYPFRYELIYDREKKEIVLPDVAKKTEIFNLIYVFLDIFSSQETKKLGSWVFPELEKARIEMSNGTPLLDLATLINLKVTAFFEREKLDKEIKDACDLYALLFYSGKSIKLTTGIKKAAEKMMSRDDLQSIIAEQVLGDALKLPLVVAQLRKLIE